MSEPANEFMAQFESMATGLRSLHEAHGLQKDRIADLEAENAQLHQMLDDFSRCLLQIQRAATDCLDILNGRAAVTDQAQQVPPSQPATAQEQAA